MKRYSVTIAVVFVFIGAGAVADPRWWWDDQQVFGGGTISSVDLDAVPPISRSDAPAIFIAWVNPPGMIEGAVHLGASFDGGCSFCSTHVATLFSGTGEVALAAAPDFKNNRYSVQIVYSTGNPSLVVVASDTEIPLGASPDEKCAALMAMTPSVQGLSGTGADSPDIAAVVETSGSPQFHAVWKEKDAVGGFDVYYSRDLVGDGAAWDMARSLTRLAPPTGSVDWPRVSADLVYQSSGGGGSGVNVVFADTSTCELFYLRSSDSGTNFSATGDPAPSAPAVLNDPMIGYGFGSLALDTASPGGTPGEAAWHGVLFYQESSIVPRLLFDAALQTAPAQTNPTWASPDALVDEAGLDSEGGPALAVFPRGNTGPAPVFLFWTDALGGSGYQLFYRAGGLSSSGPPAVDLDTFPWKAVRATDPKTSTLFQLTDCAWDDVTGGCAPASSGGRAVKASVDETWGDVFAAWIDTRSGMDEVWFKRTDRAVFTPAPTAACSSPSPNERRITVSWPPRQPCNAVSWDPEKIAQYFIYYGVDPGGPFLNTDLDGSNPGVPDTIIVKDTGSLPDPVSVDIDGLLPGTTYFVAVVPEDQARNLSPPDFDAATDLPSSLPNETSCATEPGAGGPDLYRATTTDPAMARSLFGPADPLTGVSFVAPNDVPYIVAFVSGGEDPEQVLLPSAAPVGYYQMEGPGLKTLMVTKAPANQTVRIDF